MTKKELVIGSGRVGAAVAYLEARKGKQVTVVDHDAQAFQNLAPDFGGYTLEGDIRNHQTQKLAGFSGASAIYVLTDNEALNFMIAVFARLTYRIPRVACRMEDRALSAEAKELGIVPLSESIWIVRQLEGETLWQI